MGSPPTNGKRNGSTAELVAVIIKRSAPNRHRPRCSTATENRLAEIEAATAACYGRSELLSAKLRNLADSINEETEQRAIHPEIDGNHSFEGLPNDDWDDTDEDNSVVVHIDQLRAQAKID